MDRYGNRVISEERKLEVISSYLSQIYQLDEEEVMEVWRSDNQDFYFQYNGQVENLGDNYSQICERLCNSVASMP